jgi:hypothetical protein
LERAHVSDLIAGEHAKGGHVETHAFVFVVVGVVGSASGRAANTADGGANQSPLHVFSAAKTKTRFFAGDVE